MGIPAINSLANMEYMLYGGTSGVGRRCPSYTNGYMAADSLASGMYPNYFGYYNPAFQANNYGYNTNSIYNTYTPAAQGAASQYQTSGTSFQQGITQDDINRLSDYYAKNNALEEGFKGAAAGGLSWMAFEHAQSLLHPMNAFKGAKAAEAVFKNVPKGFAKENAVLLQEAYTAVQQATRDTGKKWITSGWLRRSIDEKAVQGLVKEMQAAVNKKDIGAIAKATERLQAARGFDGKLISWISPRKTVAERLAKKQDTIAQGAKNLVNVSKGNIGALIKSGFKKDFVGFMIFETIFNAGKIMTAFGKDTKTGIKQTGQSLGKSAAGTAGWCIGRAVGTWAGAKLGAAIGTAVCPGAGTAIGALVGFTVGSIGMWAGHKLGEKIFGSDVADKVEAENLAKTQQGQVQLLQFAMEKANEGKKLDSATAQALQHVYNAYA